MSKTDILAELPRLKPEERQEIRLKLAELDNEDWLDGDESTPDHRALLDARLASYETNPMAGSSWTDVEGRLREKLKR